MLIFLQELVLQVFIWLLRLADGIMEIFSSVVGVASVDYQGSQVNLIEFVIANKSVTPRETLYIRRSLRISKNRFDLVEELARHL